MPTTYLPGRVIHHTGAVPTPEELAGLLLPTPEVPAADVPAAEVAPPAEISPVEAAVEPIELSEPVESEHPKKRSRR